ncbi:MAG: YjbQ family protein, partial [Methylophilaceae bacterium]|nr:YjbQ family protein [Methylophilaceae bacterium]
NADAHIKRQVMGREVVVAVTAGELDFGPWEQIIYGEFKIYSPIILTSTRFLRLPSNSP